MEMPSLWLNRAGHTPHNFPHGGAATLDFADAAAPLTARWFNPRSAAFAEPRTLTLTNHRQSFQASDTNDWVLLVSLAKRVGTD